jgi:diguanylate cyclase (GGDEF)-like protein/PAS domain S-box-containing protein
MTILGFPVSTNRVTHAGIGTKVSMSDQNTSQDVLDREINSRLVLSLYDGQSTSVFGVFCHVMSCLAAWGISGDSVYLYLAAMIFIIFLGRMFDIRQYWKAFNAQPIIDEAFTRKWEVRYLLGIYPLAVWMGLLSFYSVIAHTYTTATFIAIGVTFGTLVSISGRNYGSKQFITIILALGCAPMGFSMAYMGYVEPDLERSFWLYFTGAIFVPFIIVAYGNSKQIRSYVASSMRKSRENELMAAKFDAAINNQPNGMIMFDAEERVSVINPMAKRLLRMESNVELKGMSINDLLFRVVQNNGYSNDQFDPILDSLMALHEGREQRVQIKTNDGRYLEFSSNLTNADESTYEGSVVVFEDVSARIEAEEKMARLANFDALSKIPNRGYLNRRLPEAAAELSPGETIALAVFDIDKFKLINDTMGHNAGDSAIKQIATKLQEINDPRAIFGRFGGDEFVLAFINLTRFDNLTEMFDDAFNLINSTMAISGHKVDIRVSGGVYHHKKGTFDLDDALSKADTALRKVKPHPTQVWSFFTNEMEVEHFRTLKLKAAIKDAISNNDFTNMYQPMYRPDGSNFDCCEALARWVHPELGSVPPDAFIRVAEEIGLIQQVTRQILMRACADCHSWPNETSVSVNLSTLDLSHPDVVPMVRHCLTASGLNPNRLQIEVTETVFVNDFDKTARTLHTLSNLGIKIALDDFGTGYSNLAYLNRLPLDKVKIDRSFILHLGTDPQARLLFNGVVRLSKEMQFEIVVEGVETDEQLRMVTEAESVDRIQGYIFSRPETSATIIERLNELNSPPPTPSNRKGSLVSLKDYRRKSSTR